MTIIVMKEEEEEKEKEKEISSPSTATPNTFSSSSSTTSARSAGGEEEHCEWSFSEVAGSALEEFAQSENKTLNPKLMIIIQQIAATGLSCYPWTLIKQVLALRLRDVLKNFLIEESEVQKRYEHFFSSLENFSDPPFTIQRICELLLSPDTYSHVEKYLFALEKLVFVNSTTPTLSPTNYNQEVAVLARQKREVELLKESYEQPPQVPTNNIAAFVATTAHAAAVEESESMVLESQEEKQDTEAMEL